MTAVAVWLSNPQNVVLLMSILSSAAQGIQKVYTAWELQSIADLEAAVKADLVQLDTDVKVMDDDIDARDKALEDELKK